MKLGVLFWGVPLGLAIALSVPASADAFTLHVTSDIHAGSRKDRDYTSYTKKNIIYPKQGAEAFERFLKKKGDVFIALGDNIDSCDDWESAKELKKIVEKSHKKVLFGFGNHDCSKGFRYLSKKKYFSYDKENVRIIVLNTEETPGGAPSSGQLDWLEQQLDTDKKVVIAMSKPAYKKDLKTKKENYARFFKIVESKMNITHIFAGDYHVKNAVKTFEKSANIKWHFVPALTLKGNKEKIHTVEL